MSPEQSVPAGDGLRGWAHAATAALAAIVLLIPLSVAIQRVSRSGQGTKGPSVTFVGAQACRECHEREFEAWKGSDHDHAMAPATAETVRGDFGDVTFDDGHVRARFFTRGGRYLVETAGPDGNPREYTIAYTFGWEPLQQYLIPFPGGRYQCLTVAWDTEYKRWFNLYPGQDIPGTDWLHWTRAAQNWNGMCAECHSTNLKKGYEPGTHNFHTTWSEIDVSCEACHGPGSEHVAWARIPAMGRPRAVNAGLPVKTSGISSRQLVELCAPCHSRRSEIGDYDHTNPHLLDAVLPRVLEEGLYYPDGQILSEDYVYGSFLQSKMYDREVRCLDCHDPHSLKLHFSGNRLCEQCHRAEDYDTPSHHFHKATWEGKPSRAVLCTSCHMPERAYMVVDMRADHSIRIPRPDLTRAIGVPNACSQEGCHADRALSWVLEAWERWYGIAGKPHYGTVIAAGRQFRTEAGPQLARLSGNTLYPSIVRATALTLLRGYPGETSTEAFNSALSDEDPLVRHTAASSVNVRDRKRLVELLVPLLFDPVKGVRMEAAGRLAGTPEELLAPYQRRALRRGIREYVASQEHSLDFPHANFNLGNLYQALGDPERAEAYYRRALEVDEIFLPAMNNLALLLNSQGRNEEAQKILQRAVKAYPGSGETTYSLGLLLAEMERYPEAEEALARAAELLPGNPRIHYNRGLLLQRILRPREAEKELLHALQLDPDSPNTLLALADLYLKAGRLDSARAVTDELLRRHPGHEAGQKLRIILGRLGGGR